MRKYIFLAFALLTFFSCQESIEEKAERESKEFTKKNCPSFIAKDIRNDSLVFDKDTRTIHYYFTVCGELDTENLNKQTNKEDLVKSVRNATSIRNYKKEKFNFTYTYFSEKNKGKILLDITITPNDYENR